MEQKDFSNSNTPQQPDSSPMSSYKKKNYIPRRALSWEEKIKLEDSYPSRIDLSEPTFDFTVNFNESYKNYR